MPRLHDDPTRVKMLTILVELLRRAPRYIDDAELLGYCAALQTRLSRYLDSL